MRRSSLLFLSLNVFGNFARAFPQPSDAASTGSSDGSCEADCQIEFPSLKVLAWESSTFSIEYTTTITAATVQYFTNRLSNSTRTSTVYNTDISTLPAETTAAETGSETTLTITRGPDETTTTAITYPSNYYDYDTQYSWVGTLGTSGICSTDDTWATVILPSHPEYQQPASQGGEFAPVSGDYGTTYSAYWKTVSADMTGFFKMEFTEAAFTSCSLWGQSESTTTTTSSETSSTASSTVIETETSSTTSELSSSTTSATPSTHSTAAYITVHETLPESPIVLATSNSSTTSSSLVDVALPVMSFESTSSKSVGTTSGTSSSLPTSKPYRSLSYTRPPSPTYSVQPFEGGANAFSWSFGHSLLTAGAGVFLAAIML